MKKQIPKVQLAFTSVAFLLQAAVFAAVARAESTPYPAMAPLAAYLIADQNAEIAMARSSAPASLSDNADVMVLGRQGYTTVVKGTNGFVCIVERSWANSTDDSDFWNPKIRSPNCFNPASARTFLPIYLMKTRLVLAGKSKQEIVAATTSAFEAKELLPLEPGSMCYMMSKLQYLGDDSMAWHPHLMFFVAGDAAKDWGAGLPGSPVMAANDPEEHATIFMVLARRWSDGTPIPAAH
jgi:hypothetical protein